MSTAGERRERDGGHAALMDGVYRWQRHIYDATRKYYLLGRDRMIAGLHVPPGGSVLELGCGTGRNLLLAARRYPDARLHGLDISAAMLETADAALSRRGLRGRVALARADATRFDAEVLFGKAYHGHAGVRLYGHRRESLGRTDSLRRLRASADAWNA